VLSPSLWKKRYARHTVDLRALPGHSRTPLFVVVGHQADEVRRRRGARRPDSYQRRTERARTSALAGRESPESMGGLLVVYYGDCPQIPAAAQVAGWSIRATRMPRAACEPRNSTTPRAKAALSRDRHQRPLAAAVVEQEGRHAQQMAMGRQRRLYCFRSRSVRKEKNTLASSAPQPRAANITSTEMVAI